MKREYPMTKYSHGWFMRSLRRYRYEDATGVHVAKWAVNFTNPARGLDLLLHGDGYCALMNRVYAEIDQIEGQQVVA